MKVQVKQVFRNKITQHLYAIGEVVEFDDEQRVADMVERGLADIVIDEEDGKIKILGSEFEKSEVIDALKAAGIKGNVQAMKPDTLLAKVAGLDETQLTTFKQALSQK